MSCALCVGVCNCRELDELREMVTVFKAERDEAIHVRDAVHEQLMNLLAVVHRDGGKYAAEHGVAKAIVEAVMIVVALRFKVGSDELTSPEKNRSEIARMRAGLSLGQAAKLTGIARDELVRIEVAQTLTDKVAHNLAELYGVSFKWITGMVPRYDFERMKDVPGWDEMTEHDRKVVSEFAASLPERKK
jgi:helix-turn-helix protein